MLNKVALSAVLIAASSMACAAGTQNPPPPLKKGCECFADAANAVYYNCRVFKLDEKTFDKVTVAQIYERGWRVVATQVSGSGWHNIIIEEQ